MQPHKGNCNSRLLHNLGLILIFYSTNDETRIYYFKPNFAGSRSTTSKLYSCAGKKKGEV